MMQDRLVSRSSVTHFRTVCQRMTEVLSRIKQYSTIVLEEVAVRPLSAI